jgi:hypothetical protein
MEEMKKTFEERLKEQGGVSVKVFITSTITI